MTSSQKTGRMDLRNELKLIRRADPEVVAGLSAYHEFEEERLKLAARDTKYNTHPNDHLDSLQLVYLGDQALHFLTGDG